MANRTTELLNAFGTTLAAEMSSVAGSMTLNSTTGLIAPCYLVLEPDNGSQREYVYVSAINASVCTVTERYLTGSAAGSGLTHPVDSDVRMSPLAQHIEDLNDRVDDALAQIASGGDHGGLTGLADDDHSQYHNTARHAAVDHDALVDHGSIGGLGDDDHSIYHTDARAVTWHDADDHSAVTPGDIGAAPAAEGVTNGDSHDHAGGDGAQIDHGGLGGLADDDHTNYHTDARATTWHDADDHSGLVHVLATFTELGELTEKTGTVEWPLPYDCTITEVKLRVSTAPTGQAIVVDVNVDGTTIDTGTKPQIAASSQSGTDTTFTDASHLEDQVVSIDIDQIGSGTVGSDLVVVVMGTRD